MESIQDALHRLHAQLHGYPWYANHSAVSDILHNSLIAYVHEYNMDIEKTVPRTVDGYEVRIHFIGSAKMEKPKPLATIPFYVPPVAAPVSVDNLSGPELTTAFDVHNEVWQLQRVCGKDNLVDIFYEVHDGDDAVTEVGKEFPDVKTQLKKLYDEFGFDILFEEIDA